MAVHLDADRIGDAKPHFFRPFNAIFSKTARCSYEPVMLSLLRSKCMPMLSYVVEACPLLTRRIQPFEFTLPRIFMKLFTTESSRTVIECQVNSGFLPGVVC